LKTSPAKNNVKVFVVDDDKDDQQFLKTAFEEIGQHAEFHFFDNGKQLMDVLEQDQTEKDFKYPQLILLDLNMPLLNGKQTLKLLQKLPNFSSVPVIVLSTSNSRTEIEECYNLGAKGYFCKPSRHHDYIAMVNMLVKYWIHTIQRPDHILSSLSKNNIISGIS